MVELAAQVGGQAYVLDLDVSRQPSLTERPQQINYREIITRSDDAGVHTGFAIHTGLAAVLEAGVFEQQQLLHVGPLQQPAKQDQELLALHGIETCPVLTERAAAHLVGVEE